MANQCLLIILRPAQNEASETLTEPADYITLIDGELQRVVKAMLAQEECITVSRLAMFAFLDSPEH